MTTSKKIKVLMVIGSTGIGGAQAFILNVLRNIDTSKFQIDFAVNKFAPHDGIEQECSKYGCNFYQLPYFTVYNYIRFKRAWEDFLSTHQYDIVHGHSTNSAAIYLGIAHKYGMKTIAHSHSAGYRGNAIERFVKMMFARKVKQVSDYWFACSDIAARRLYGKAFKTHKKYHYIPNAIDTNKYLFNSQTRTKIREKLNIDKDTILYGHVGSFSAPKNHMFLIDVFVEVCSITPMSKLLCCGVGTLMESVKEYAKTKGILDKVIFAGVVNNVNEYMMAMDTFIFPSIFEGFPMAILEAQASGLNIVMSDTITNEIDLTNNIYRMELQQSPTEWAKVSVALPVSIDNRTAKNAIIAESQYNIKTAVKSFEKLYKELVKDGK